MDRSKRTMLAMCAVAGLIIGLAAGQIAWTLWPIK